MPYQAPLRDIRFILNRVTGFDAIAATALFADATPDVTEAILTGAARLSEDMLAPLRQVSDRNPARLENGVVRTSPGFAEAYRALAEGGWVSIAASPEIGGAGLPMTLASAVNEMMSAACPALQMNPLMTQGQIEALEHHGSDALKAIYLPKLLSGDWCGTMNLTEAQAGSDVGALRTRAEPNADGTYAITGQKIYISWADNDFTANVCHLVLARLPDAPEGTRGISLFMVPKLIPDDQGNPGARNRLTVVSLEHKLGLHGSPTAVMQYDGAVGWMVGAPHRGMAAMFTMMNNARLGVAIQGVGTAEAAYQQALAHALGRVQGKTPQGGTGTIADHADVRRMLAGMRAEVFSARAIALACATALDMARATGSADWEARAALLTPIAKSFGTDTGIRVASEAIQVQGGSGYIEDSGAAQYLRDIRVTAIYEGSNGIQAMDLVGRKLADGGEAAFRLLDEVQAGAEAARAVQPDLAGDVWAAAEGVRETVEWLLTQPMTDRQAGAVPFQRAFALVLGAHFHLRAGLADPDRLPLAHVAIRRLLPEHAGLIAAARAGAEGLYAMTPESLSA